MHQKRILFVCHGNICRSPMAEMIFRDMLRRQGLDADVTVASCATSTEEIYGGRGNPIYPPAKEELMRRGIPIAPHRAVQLTPEDYDRYDLLIGMDSANIRNMHRMLGGDPKGKICKLLSFAGRDADVADPWYSGRFEQTYDEIADGCRGLLAYLLRA